MAAPIGAAITANPLGAIALGVGLLSNIASANQQRQAVERQAALRQPAIDFFQGVLSDPNAGISNLGQLTGDLSGRAESRIEEAIRRAQEAADANAVRRGIFSSGVAQENARDIQERGMETLANTQAQIDQFATNLVNQRQQQAASALANPNLTDPRAAGLLDASQAFQQFGSQLLSPIGNVFETAGQQGNDFLTQLLQDVFKPRPTASFVNRVSAPGVSQRPLFSAPSFGAGRR